VIKISLPDARLRIPRDKRVAIWDLDNCITDDHHRIHLIDWGKSGDEKFERYNQQMDKDPVMNYDWFDMVNSIAMPVFFTGRPMKFREQTEAWIKRHLNVERPIVFMRDSPGIPWEVKQQMLWTFFMQWDLSPLHISAAFDDVPAVIKMYQDHGIPAVLLQVHDPKMVYLPNEL
jgi:hypothetical protein